METVENRTLTTSRTTGKMPSPPQVLVGLLDAVSDRDIGLRDLADVISRDTATATRLLHIANTGYYQRGQRCESIGDALKLLGMDSVKTLVVTAAIRQYFSHLDAEHDQLMQRFWLRSLIAAHAAHSLASLTRYHSPAEAYLAALMMDTGQLYLLGENHNAYAALLTRHGDDDHQLVESEKETLDTTHCDVGAALLEQWQLDNFMSDAVRYHHESAEQVRHGHHLVKIINLSSDLSLLSKPSSQTLEKAHQLFGLNESLTLEMRARIGKDVRVIADQLGIQTGANGDANVLKQAREQLGESLNRITQLTALREQLSASAAAGPEALQASIARTLHMSLGVGRHIFFIENITDGTLEGFSRDEGRAAPLQSDFAISPTMEQSLVVRCLNQQKMLSSNDATDPLPLVDRQLLRHCRQPLLIAMPFACDQGRGVLVAGADEAMLQQHTRKQSLFGPLLGEIAPLFTGLVRERGNDTDTASASPYTEAQIRETLHEVSNPLSIINNYLDMLRLKLQEEHEAQEDIAVLREEINRVGHLLMRLRSPAEPGEEHDTDVNELIRELASVLDRSMCRTNSIHLELSLDPEMPKQKLDAPALKQILTNLLKNAIEAMPQGGKLNVSSRARFNCNGRNHHEISIQDNGPGIPEETLDTLFNSARSRKGPSHGGLGLKIVKQLVDKMDAQIQCSSDSSGTRFSILLPARHEASRGSS